MAEAESVRIIKGEDIVIVGGSLDQKPKSTLLAATPWLFIAAIGTIILMCFDHIVGGAITFGGIVGGIVTYKSGSTAGIDKQIDEALKKASSDTRERFKKVVHAFGEDQPYGCLSLLKGGISSELHLDALIKLYDRFIPKGKDGVGGSARVTIFLSLHEQQ